MKTGTDAEKDLTLALLGAIMIVTGAGVTDTSMTKRTPPFSNILSHTYTIGAGDFGYFTYNDGVWVRVPLGRLAADSSIGRAR